MAAAGGEWGREMESLGIHERKRTADAHHNKKALKNVVLNKSSLTHKEHAIRFL